MIIALVGNAPSPGLFLFGGGADDLPVPTADPEEVRRAADEILTRPELVQPVPSLMERAGDFLSDVVGEILMTLFEGTSGNTVLGWVILGALLGAIAFLLARFAVGMQRGGYLDGPVFDGIDPAKSARDLDAEADEHEHAGRWSEAIRLRYGALVVALVEHDVVSGVAGRTTGEFRRELAQAAPDASPQFTQASDLFDRVFYAGQVADATDAAAMKAGKSQVLKVAC